MYFLYKSWITCNQNNMMNWVKWTHYFGLTNLKKTGNNLPLFFFILNELNEFWQHMTLETHDYQQL